MLTETHMISITAIINKQGVTDFEIYREMLHTKLWKDDTAFLSLAVLGKLQFKSNS